MPLLEQLLSHHAHAVIGPAEAAERIVTALDESHQISIQGNPDAYLRVYEVFTIDDARGIHSLHATRPVGADGKKIFILSMNGITAEAQNALLKLFEEPAEYAHFFLIIPSAHLLLPTMKSRMNMLDLGTGSTVKRKENSEMSEVARDFLKSSRPKRLEIIKKLTEDITKKKKTKQDAVEFLDAVQSELYARDGVKKSVTALEAVETARRYIHDRAPSVKMLLEYVALSI